MRVGQLYTLDETAAVLRKSTRTLRRMLHEGKLAGTKVGGTWRIPESELERLTRGRVPVLD
jgi:excisionase family DNA binding protein